jgi:hypothetical protein
MNQENNITIAVWAEVIKIDYSNEPAVEGLTHTVVTATEQFNINFFGSLGKNLQKNIIDEMLNNLIKDYDVIMDTGVRVDIRKTSDISDYELDPRIASALGLYYA